MESITRLLRVVRRPSRERGSRKTLVAVTDAKRHYLVNAARVDARGLGQWRTAATREGDFAAIGLLDEESLLQLVAGAV